MLIDTRLYDDGGRLEKSTYGNGVVTDFTYFDDSQTDSISINATGPSLIDSFDYTYDANKNVETETRGGTMSAYSWTTDNSGSSGYDSDDRLTNWNCTNASMTQSWSLTAVGDWSSFTDTGTTQTRAHSNAHEINGITTGGSTATLVHDVKGNLTTNSNTHTYGWDFDNLLASVDTDGDTVADKSFEYDALGRRVKIDTEILVCAGQQLIARYTAASLPANPSSQFVYASYIDEPIYLDDRDNTAAYYYHRNRQYSVSALTDSAGAVTERYTYDAYGSTKILAANGTTVRTASTMNNPLYSDNYFYRPR